MGFLDYRAVTSPRNLPNLGKHVYNIQLLELLKTRKMMKQSRLKQDHRQREIPEKLQAGHCVTEGI